MRHLVRVAARGAETGMTPRNVAIVWAPNLLRCKELEVGGVAALQGVGVQAVVTEFLVCYAELIFGDGPVGRPKSLAITTPARLLSLEEARNRSLRGEPDYVEVGAGPAGLPLHYHTVIELPRKRNGSKRSPSLNWRALFGRGGLGARGKTRQVGTPPQTETVPSSLNSLRRLRPVKSADSLDGEDSLGPLLGPPPARPCGHSRSVSHDSYFDHLADAPNTSSPLDLSEIQLNFDLEEREMRMFSEEESGGVASVEASPRRQRTEGTQNTAATGGSKRKRSRLEERLQCDVELRFIDSQSPDQVNDILHVFIYLCFYNFVDMVVPLVLIDIFNARSQVMVSADVHSMDTPSPLPTPGYLPLLSEASTPLTPATLHGTPHSTSPVPANSPRISFRSFTLPLEIDEEQSNANKLNRTSVSSDKSSDPSHRLSVNLEGQSNAKSCERIMTYDKHVDLYDDKESSKAQKTSKESNLVVSDVVDQDMTPCDRLMSHPSEIESSKVTMSPCKDVENRSSSCSVDDNKSHCDNRDTLDVRKHDASTNKSIGSQHDDAMAGNSNAHRNELPGLPLSSATDLDSPMSCEQTIEDLPDSGFVICDNSDKIFTNTETSQMISNTNDSGEWVIVETTGSITTPTSESSSSKDPLEGTVNNAIATDAPQLRSMSENVSRTSLDLTMGSTVDTDTSCIGVSDLTESPVLPQESAEMTFDVADNRDLVEHDATAQRTSRAFEDQTSFGMVNSGNNYSNIVHSPIHDQDNGNQKIRTVSMTDIRMNQKSSEMEHEVTACYSQLDNTEAFNRNENPAKEEAVVEEKTFESSQRSSKSHSDFQQKEIRRSLQLHQKPQFQANDRRSFSNQSKKSQDLDLSLANTDNKQRSQSQKPEKCQSFEYVSPKESAQNSQQHKQFPTRTEDPSKCNNVKNSQLQEHIEVVIPSENAAEPSEIAHPPEGASEPTSLNSSCTFSNASSPVDDSIVLRDTAAILQELALQRLSGGIVGDLSVPPRRRYETENNKDRRSFDSEIGREIVRERKMRQELDSARGKSEEPPVNNTQHLPPCLRARHARATRASLSRSLDEAKFNKMSEEASLPVKQATEDVQHSSTPNVGTGSSNSSSANSDKTHLKNLGGLDLGDPQCRERIEKYKEERRTFLRDKYRSESFRGMLSKTEDDGEQALLARLKQRATRPSLH